MGRFTYHPGEPSRTKWVIAICYNTISEEGHYVVHTRFNMHPPYGPRDNPFDTPVERAFNRIDRTIFRVWVDANRQSSLSSYKYEPFMKPHIVECMWLPSGECVAIIKTRWLREFQQRWRRWHTILQWTCRPEVQRYRQLYGRLPPTRPYHKK